MEISVTDSEEVFVAGIASGATMPSRVRNSACSANATSTIASTTSWRSFASAMFVVKVVADQRGLLVLAQLPALTARSVECWTCWRPRSRDSSVSSTPTTW